jgi:hypothetical protein
LKDVFHIHTSLLIIFVTQQCRVFIDYFDRLVLNLSPKNKNLLTRFRFNHRPINSHVILLQEPSLPRENGNIEVENSGNTVLEDLENKLVEIIYDYVLKKHTDTENDSRSIQQNKKEAVKKNHQNACQICNRTFQGKDLQIDHMLPYAYGGSNDIINLMPLCKEFNLDKGKRMEYYRSDDGREKIKANFRTFVRKLPIVGNFDEWLKEMRETYA